MIHTHTKAQIRISRYDNCFKTMKFQKRRNVHNHFIFEHTGIYIHIVLQLEIVSVRWTDAFYDFITSVNLWACGQGFVLGSPKECHMFFQMLVKPPGVWNVSPPLQFCVKGVYKQRTPQVLNSQGCKPSQPYLVIFSFLLLSIPVTIITDKLIIIGINKTLET